MANLCESEQQSHYFCRISTWIGSHLLIIDLYLWSFIGKRIRSRSKIKIKIKDQRSRSKVKIKDQDQRSRSKIKINDLDHWSCNWSRSNFDAELWYQHLSTAGVKRTVDPTRDWTRSTRMIFDLFDFWSRSQAMILIFDLDQIIGDLLQLWLYELC